MSLNGIDIGDSQVYMDVKSIDGDFVIITKLKLMKIS